MTAPQAMAQALHARGATSRALQAAAVGEDRAHWVGFVTGRKRPTLAKVERWLQAADESGHTFHLTYDPHVGWVCRVAQ
jgi:hypothetical protein